MNTNDNSTLIRKTSGDNKKCPNCPEFFIPKISKWHTSKIGSQQEISLPILHYITFFNHPIYFVYTWLLLCIVNVYFCPLERSFEKHNPRADRSWLCSRLYYWQNNQSQVTTTPKDFLRNGSLLPVLLLHLYLSFNYCLICFCICICL